MELALVRRLFSFTHFILGFSAVSAALITLAGCTAAGGIGARPPTPEASKVVHPEALEDLGQAEPAPASSITLAQAIETALSKNFNSRIEFEHRIEVKDTAKAAYLNLLPHLSLSSILSNLTPSAVSLLGAICDLAPFLLPTNWMRAEQASLAQAAEQDAWILMRADLANEVEGLTYGLARDEGILASHLDMRERLRRTYEVVSRLEAQHELPLGSTLNLESVVNSIDLDIASLRLVIKQDRLIIAQALGMDDPSQAQEVTVGVESTPIGSATPLNPSDLTEPVVKLSYELKQQDTLIEIAKSKKHAIWFGWLDPSADPTQGLGFGLGAQVRVAKDHLKELAIQREQVQVLLKGKVAGAAAEFNEALGSFHLAEEGVRLQKERWDFVNSEIFPGSTLNTMDVEGVVEDWITSTIKKETVLASFRVARSKVERLLFQGFYAPLVGDAKE